MFCHVHPFTSPKFTATAKCEIYKCETCEYVNANINTTKEYNQISKTDADGALKASYTHPGDCVFVDHFESNLKRPSITSFVLSYSEQ